MTIQFNKLPACKGFFVFATLLALAGAGHWLEAITASELSPVVDS